MAFPPGRTPAGGAGGSQLDGPPPSPTAMSGGGDTPFSMRGIAGPSQVPTDAIPPEVLRGVMEAAETVGATLDSFAQFFPNQAARFGLIKDLLQSAMAELVAGGAGAISPTAAGPAAPMGGIDRGVAGGGAI
jgi:hypothetical protein